MRSDKARGKEARRVVQRDRATRRKRASYSRRERERGHSRCLARHAVGQWNGKRRKQRSTAKHTGCLRKRCQRICTRLHSNVASCTSGAHDNSFKNEVDGGGGSKCTCTTRRKPRRNPEYKCGRCSRYKIGINAHAWWRIGYPDAGVPSEKV